MAEQIYSSAQAIGQFIVYPGVVHTITTRMFHDLHTSFAQHKQPWIPDCVNALIDFNGDGKTGIAVYRPSTGVWYIYPSRGGSPYGVGWGISTDIPVTTNFASYM